MDIRHPLHVARYVCRKKAGLQTRVPTNFRWLTVSDSQWLYIKSPAPLPQPLSLIHVNGKYRP